MTLAELPYNTACTIQRVGHAVRDTAYHVAAGIQAGSPVRVLARYPEVNPRYVEVEVAGHLVVTLPLPLAADVSLECGCC
jgi:hypothetical protein